MRKSTHETIIILDFGSQYTQLIARRVREAGVYCEILPFNTPAAEIHNRKPKGLILSGGPSSVYDDAAPRMMDGLIAAFLTRALVSRKKTWIEFLASFNNRLLQSGAAAPASVWPSHTL